MATKIADYRKIKKELLIGEKTDEKILKLLKEIVRQSEIEPSEELVNYHFNVLKKDFLQNIKIENEEELYQNNNLNKENTEKQIRSQAKEFAKVDILSNFIFVNEKLKIDEKELDEKINELKKELISLKTETDIEDEKIKYFIENSLKYKAVTNFLKNL